MSDTETRPEPTNLNGEILSVRFLQREGGKTATLSVVVGGVHYLWKVTREQMLVCVESGIEAIRKQG